MKTIQIFNPKEGKYRMLSNNFISNTNIDGENWKSISNYIFAQALPSVMYRDKIKNADIEKIHEEFKYYKNKSDEDVLSVALLEALKVKFQNPKIMEILLNTGNSPIIYQSNNGFLGNGRDGNGKNMLGNYMVQIRNEVLNEKNRQRKIDIQEESIYKVYLAKYVLQGLFDRDDSLERYLDLSFDEIINKYESPYDKSKKGREELEKVSPTRSTILHLYNDSSDDEKKFINLAITYPNVLYYKIRKDLENLAMRKQKKLKNKIFDIYVENLIKNKNPDLKKEQIEIYKNDMISNLSFEAFESLKNKVYDNLSNNKKNPTLYFEVKELISEAKIPTKEEIQDAKNINIEDINFLEKNKKKEIFEYESEDEGEGVQFNPNSDIEDYIIKQTRKNKNKNKSKFMEEIVDNSSSDDGASDDEYDSDDPNYFEKRYPKNSPEARELERKYFDHEIMMKERKKEAKADRRREKKMNLLADFRLKNNDEIKDAHNLVMYNLVKKVEEIKEKKKKQAKKKEAEKDSNSNYKDLKKEAEIYLENFKKTDPEEYKKIEERIIKNNLKNIEDTEKGILHQEELEKKMLLDDEAQKKFLENIKNRKKLIMSEPGEIKEIRDPASGQTLKVKIKNPTYTETDDLYYDQKFLKKDPKKGYYYSLSDKVKLVPSLLKEDAFTLDKYVTKIMDKPKETDNLGYIPIELVNVGEPVYITAGNPPVPHETIQNYDRSLLSPIFFTGMLNIRGLEYPTICHYLYSKLFGLECKLNTIKEEYLYILNYSPESEYGSQDSELGQNSGDNSLLKFIPYDYLGEYLDYIRYVKNQEIFKKLTKEALDIKFINMKYQDELILTESNEIIYNDWQNSYLGTKNIIKYNISRDKYKTTEKFIVASRKTGAKVREKGFNYVGQYLMILREQIIKNRLDETLITKNNFNKLYIDSLTIKEWADSRTDDMCKTILKFNQYYKQKYASTIDLNKDIGIKTIIKNIYGKAKEILNLVDSVIKPDDKDNPEIFKKELEYMYKNNNSNPDVFKRKLIKDYKNRIPKQQVEKYNNMLKNRTKLQEKYDVMLKASYEIIPFIYKERLKTKYKDRFHVYDNVFWSNIFANILFLVVNNVPDLTTYKIEKILYGSNILLSRNRSCIQIIPTLSDNKLNCIIAAILNILSYIQKIYYEGVIKTYIKIKGTEITEDGRSIEVIHVTEDSANLILSRTEGVVDFAIDKVDIDLAVSIILNTKSLVNIDFKSQEEKFSYDLTIENDEINFKPIAEGEGEGEEEDREEDDGTGDHDEKDKEESEAEELCNYITTYNLFGTGFSINKTTCKLILNGAKFISEYKHLPDKVKINRYNFFSTGKDI